MSSKGQVVLPKDIRQQLNLGAGARLAAYAIGDMIMLKKVEIPQEADFIKSLDEASAWAKSVGYKEEDIDDIIKSYRKKKTT
jgi:antitoxin PrlF